MFDVHVHVRVRKKRPSEVGFAFRTAMRNSMFDVECSMFDVRCSRFMSAAPLVEFNEVIKRFGDGPLVLDRISFNAHAGEFVSIIGPSGCGKSTLLRLIAGLSPITGGTLQVNG